MPGGPDLDSWTAGQQSRDLQRDAPVRLGACAALVSFGGLWVLGSLFRVELSGWWLFPISLAIGVATARVANRIAERKDAIRVSREQAERKALKEAEMAAFLADRDSKMEKS